MDKPLENLAGLLDVSSSNLLLAAGAGAAVLGIYNYLGRSPKAPSPPGPPSLPIIGNLPHIPEQYPWLKFTDWKQEYGDIVRVHGLGNEMIILNDIECANDLLLKQGATFSDRPRFVLASELMGVSRAMLMMDNTKTWQLHKKLVNIGFGPDSVKQYYSMQEDIAAMMIVAMIDDPEHFADHARLAQGRIIIGVTYGILPRDAQPAILHAEKAMTLFVPALDPGASIVDAMPFLKYLPTWTPFADFHPRGKLGRAAVDKMVYEPFRVAKEEIDAGKPRPPSFVAELLELPKDVYEDVDIVTWVAGTGYGAGVETTYGVIMNAFVALAMYPDKLRAAQEELDRVVGDRFLTIADKESTPYLCAVIREALRWYPAMPLGLPRRCSEEQVYRGYRIPKNATVMVNVWAISHAPDAEFPPDQFLPERFLKRKLGKDIVDPYQYAFGFGRRLCPGRGFAENSLYILVGSFVHCMNIRPARDESGNEIPIVPTWEPRFSTHVKPFQSEVKPRSADKEALARQREASNAFYE